MQGYFMERFRLSFWGKLKKDDDGQVIRALFLIDHSANVAACCEALLEQKVIRQRLARFGGLDDIDCIQRQRLCVLAALHDVGKFNHGFQNKWSKHPPFKAGHVREALVFFNGEGEESIRFAESLDFDRLGQWSSESDVVCQLLIASICHHGRPWPIGGTIQHILWEKTSSRDPFQGIAELTEALKSWFPLAWEAGRNLPEQPAFQHAYSGLVMLSDWLGSDTRFFPLSTAGNDSSNPHSRIDVARDIARTALNRIGINATKARSSISGNRSCFQDIFGRQPYDVQKQIENLPITGNGSLTILESSTGSGKSEAALIRFLNLFRAGKVDGLYFALPTRSAATQIFHRVRSCIASAFPDQTTRPPVNLAVPGYLAVDDMTGTRLPNFDVLWEDSDTMVSRFRGWASEQPKRYLAGSIVVGTIDQVLLSRLATGHSHLRATALLRHLLVIDEVHASDMYMTRLIEEVLSWHLKAGGHALLMSATLGGTVRQQLLWPRKPAPSPSLDQCEAESFPLIIHRSADSDHLCRCTPVQQRSVTVQAVLMGAMLYPQSVAIEALKASDEGAHVLIIRNTVLDCLKTQHFLEKLAKLANRDHLFHCEGVVAPHHSRFAREDRVALDDAIENHFGKHRAAEGLVVAATQTVQQSLDLDSDFLITDLCPIDVLLQRIGRLHRHLDRRNRPPAFCTARVIVLVPEDRNLGVFIRRNGKAKGPCGIGSVYEDLCILEATWRLLLTTPELRVTSECRNLVERVLHPQVLDDIARSLGEPWTIHRNHILGGQFAQKRQADLNLVNWNAPFDSREVLFPSDSLGARVATRLGEGDRWIRFKAPLVSPFGKTFQTLTLPSHQAEDLPDEIHPDQLEVSDGAIRFFLGYRQFVYDRWGLRPSATSFGGSLPDEKKRGSLNAEV